MGLTGFWWIGKSVPGVREGLKTTVILTQKRVRITLPGRAADLVGASLEVDRKKS
jgi:hypothetical protein